jgi:hypothetical protein
LELDAHGEVQKNGNTSIRMDRVGYELCSKHRIGFGEDDIL